MRNFLGKQNTSTFLSFPSSLPYFLFLANDQNLSTFLKNYPRTLTLFFLSQTTLFTRISPPLFFRRPPSLLSTPTSSYALCFLPSSRLLPLFFFSLPPLVFLFLHFFSKPPYTSLNTLFFFYTSDLFFSSSIAHFIFSKNPNYILFPFSNLFCRPRKSAFYPFSQTSSLFFSSSTPLKKNFFSFNRSLPSHFFLIKNPFFPCNPISLDTIFSTKKEYIYCLPVHLSFVFFSCDTNVCGDHVKFLKISYIYKKKKPRNRRYKLVI